MSEPVIEDGRCGTLDWAVCATAYPGQQRSGDAFLVQATATGVLVAVVDGLGHGDEAADAAEKALASLRETAGRSPTDCLTVCHRALRGSRGAALTLAVLEPAGGRLVWIAVGNVEAAVLRPGRNGRSTRLGVPLRGGVVGDRLPPLREATAPLAIGDVLVLATDGVGRAFLDGVDLSLRTPSLARVLHARGARADDDALVFVGRFRPGANGS